MLAGAATDLAGLGSTLQIANRAAAATITGVPAAGADDVSAALAAVFSGHALDYQALSAQMAGVHQRFVQALTASGSSYAAAEAANTNPLQGVEEHLLGVLNSPTQALLGRPLIRDGAAGAPDRTAATVDCSWATAAPAEPATARPPVPGRSEAMAGPAEPEAGYTAPAAPAGSAASVAAAPSALPAVTGVAVVSAVALGYLAKAAPAATAGRAEGKTSPRPLGQEGPPAPAGTAAGSTATVEPAVSAGRRGRW
ncbi:PE family protein [Mycobacterium ulcerans str. Harvey]|uniref:PE family protein n=1 Tax=Mycobacterium ulcerans str. Harvey TaxID=1299332 RepID=A0ABN0QN56_MYCUL|nr:PE family protein [Mycobacterium ulcerans str. Harvey]